MAEDSGLTVEALEGSPGVYSARFAGPEKNDLKNCQKVLRLMEKLPDTCRGASFKSVAALATPERLIGVAEGEVRGGIAFLVEKSSGVAVELRDYDGAEVAPDVIDYSKDEEIHARA